ncbi:MAG: EF2563 family selenium-dependent molybdenum hydroxylase system protein [Chloroflexi bacterium]|nr:EF2563 family selenium-dependent molybdenum hydroxylase system protein [Chloroflexota bacterium]
MEPLSELVVLIKGAGELASGIAYCLHRHLRVCLTEVATPIAVARGVSFCEAVFDGTKTVMGVTAELVPKEKDAIYRVWQKGNIPLVIDPEALIRDQLRLDVLVDAIMAKRNTGTIITDAPLVIGVGPGFFAGKDVHIVVESNNGASLGELIFQGEAEKNSGIPVALGGLAKERVLWSPRTGVFVSDKDIGDPVTDGEVIAQIDDLPLKSPANGVLRGLLRSGVKVRQGAKIVEVDPVHDGITCNSINRKATLIGQAVLRAVRLKPGPAISD